MAVNSTGWRAALRHAAGDGGVPDEPPCSLTLGGSSDPSLGCVCRLVKQGLDRHVQASGNTNERTEGEVPLPLLKSLPILERHAELLRRLLLRPASLMTNLGNSTPNVVDHLLRCLALHRAERRSC